MAAMVVVCAALAQPVAAQGEAGARDGFEIGDRLVAGAGEVRGGFREITWDDLIPPDWLPEDLFAGLFDDADLDALDDYDPRAIEIMDKIREVWDAAPVVEHMDGQRIRIPGFVVPLEGDAGEIHEFLLVPYFGACIHVPPPPANQLIHVLPDAAIPARWNMAPVWVSGVLTVARYDSELGSAGYQLRAVEVEEYREPLPR
jgi:hypothetical protein